MQAVSLLLAWGERFVNINDKNLESKTALDILQEQPQEVDNSEMRVILDRAGASTTSSLPTVTSSYAHDLRMPVTCERAKILTTGNQVMNKITVERRNALLVVAALLVTVTYQAALTPPGGLWQDDLFKPNTTAAALSPPSPAGGLLNESNSNITAPHRAGSGIAMTSDFFVNFFRCNTLIFFLSNVTIVVLVPPVEIIGLLLGSVCIILGFCYLNSMLLILQAPAWMAIYFSVVSFVTLGILMAFPLRFMLFTSSPSALKRIRALPNLIWKRFKKEERAELGAVNI